MLTLIHALTRGIVYFLAVGHDRIVAIYIYIDLINLLAIESGISI